MKLNTVNTQSDVITMAECKVTGTQKNLWGVAVLTVQTLTGVCQDRNIVIVLNYQVRDNTP